ncbi:hypothetical protein M1116_01800 [Patescibacteria group bacterium]|nr:hypothetical protein [Patescibacteria group bacterium]
MTSVQRPPVSNLGEPYLSAGVADARTARVISTKFTTHAEVADLPVTKLRWLLGNLHVDAQEVARIHEYAMSHRNEAPPPFEAPPPPQKRKYTQRRPRPKPISRAQELVNQIVALRGEKTFIKVNALMELRRLLMDLQAEKPDWTKLQWKGVDVGLLVAIRLLIGEPLPEDLAQAMLPTGMTHKDRANAFLLLCTTNKGLLQPPPKASINSLQEAIVYLNNHPDE